jgi:HAD superfamily hydrolase (TIGR01509 family)
LSDIALALTTDVDLLCLDAGNTIIFLDHARLAELCAGVGFVTSAAALVRAEGEAKIAVEIGEGLDLGWTDAEVLGKRSWAVVVATILQKAGLARERVATVMQPIWSEHRTRNLWSVVPTGLREGVARVRARGVRVAVVSNSEGMLDRVLADLGIADVFDCLIDSAVVGVEKPDPRIFRLTLERMEVDALRTVHLGDTYATDVVGARAAGVRVGLIDVHGHYAAHHPDVPRVRSVAQLADAIAARRS